MKIKKLKTNKEGGGALEEQVCLLVTEFCLKITTITSFLVCLVLL